MRQLSLAKKLVVVAAIGLLIGVAGSLYNLHVLTQTFSHSGYSQVPAYRVAMGLHPAIYGLAQFTLAVGFRAYAEGCFEHETLRALEACRGPNYVVVHGST